MQDRVGVERLVAAAQAGDRAAFGPLYELFAPSVLGYLRALRVPDPEDTTGEVFVSLVRSLGGFEGDADAFRRWLFTIAHRRAMDAHRARTRRREDPMDPHALSDASEVAPDPADALVEQLGMGARAREAVDRLTEDQRAVVLLRIVADLSVADTAAVLGKQPGAVKTLQRRALAALRRSLILMVVS
jgi:RNA polymerase sigma factor (sigma-70 family)